jgi:hypothetical protein
MREQGSVALLRSLLFRVCVKYRRVRASWALAAGPTEKDASWVEKSEALWDSKRVDQEEAE